MGLGSLTAAVPLTARNDFFGKFSITARTAIGNAEIDAGRLRLTAQGYFSSNDRGESEASGLLGAAALGAASDPWGIALTGQRFSCATTISEIYSSAALQWRMLEAPFDMVFGVGSLYEMNGIADIARRIKPWFAIGLRRGWGFGEARVRSQFYPGLGRDTESRTSGALLGAAARADLKLHVGNMDVRADAYIETGEFLSAIGTVSTYDATVSAACGFDLSSLPLVSGATLITSAKSKQGVRGGSFNIFPAYGTFSNLLLSRYGPDIEVIEIVVTGKSIGIVPLDRARSGSLACGASFEYEFGNTSFSLKANASMYTRGRSERALFFETNLSREKSGASKEAEASNSFSDIEGLELSEESGIAGPNGGESPLFNRLTVLARVSDPNFLLSTSIGAPLSRERSDGIVAGLRAAIKLPQCTLEVSSSVKYAGTPKIFSVSSARIYVRIPF